MARGVNGKNINYKVVLTCLVVIAPALDLMCFTIPYGIIAHRKITPKNFKNMPDSVMFGTGKLNISVN